MEVFSQIDKCLDLTINAIFTYFARGFLGHFSGRHKIW